MATQWTELYSYLNLESTKTGHEPIPLAQRLYSYLNLESTKTLVVHHSSMLVLYSYLNLESTKTSDAVLFLDF